MTFVKSELPNKCCVARCRSMYSGTDEEVTVFDLLTHNVECDQWIQILFKYY